MLRNYLKIALRTFKRQPVYSLINVAGLAVCLLASLYVQEELSYDEFHEHADRIVAIGNDVRGPRRLINPYPLAEALENEVPAVEEATRVVDPSGTLRLRPDGKSSSDVGPVLTAESDFFEIFSFELVRGHPGRVLSAPNSLVLTRSGARQLFGEGEAMGRTLSWHWSDRDTTITFEVTGIAADPPQNTIFHFEGLISTALLNPTRSWHGYGYQTYARLQSPEDIEAMPRHLSNLARQHYEEDRRPSYFVEPLTALHLSELTSASSAGFTGRWGYLYLFGAIAFGILLIACVNYVNLATARASHRAGEVGVRKAVGASRPQLARQFLGESLLVTLCALALAIGLTEAALPAFNNLFGTHLTLAYTENLPFLGALVVLVGIVGLASGCYPALVLSGFEPTRVLTEYGNDGRRGALLRKGLVITQFALSAVLLISTFVIYRQLDYLERKDLGFDEERVIVAELPGSRGWGLGDEPADRAWRLRGALRHDVLAHPGVAEASVASGAPAQSLGSSVPGKPSEMSPAADVRDDQPFWYAQAVVDYQFLETLDITLVAGRDFSEDRPSDEEHAYIINEAAAGALGWTPHEAVGKSLTLDNTGQVIGVTENFHTESLRQKIDPVVLQLHEPDLWSDSGVLIARLNPGNLPAGIDHIRTQLGEYGTDARFDYTFLADEFAAMYRTERRLGSVILSGTLLAIFVACLGLFGLATFMAERRTREIGIRKALGATVTNIVGLLSKDFAKLVLIGFVIAAPAGYFLMQRWVQDFAYRIDLGPGIFLAVAAAVLGVAFLAVSYQSIKAALTDPAESLRYE